MLRVLLVFGGVLAAAPAMALTIESEALTIEGEDPASVIRQWRVAHAACEKGVDSGGKTLAAAERNDVCFESENITEILFSHGFCLSPAGQDWMPPTDRACAGDPAN